MRATPTTSRTAAALNAKPTNMLFTVQVPVGAVLDVPPELPCGHRSGGGRLLAEGGPIRDRPAQEPRPGDRQKRQDCEGGHDLRQRDHERSSSAREQPPNRQEAGRDGQKVPPSSAITPARAAAMRRRGGGDRRRWRAGSVAPAATPPRRGPRRCQSRSARTPPATTTQGAGRDPGPRVAAAASQRRECRDRYPRRSEPALARSVNRDRMGQAGSGSDPKNCIRRTAGEAESVEGCRRDERPRQLVGLKPGREDRRRQDNPSGGSIRPSGRRCGWWLGSRSVASPRGRRPCRREIGHADSRRGPWPGWR